jgi:hypothetical protein
MEHFSVAWCGVKRHGVRNGSVLPRTSSLRKRSDGQGWSLAIVKTRLLEAGAFLKGRFYDT